MVVDVDDNATPFLDNKYAKFNVKTSWVCRATLELNYRLGWGWVGLGSVWGRFGIGLGLGWVWVGVGLERKFGFQIGFQSRRSAGWVAGWPGG